MKAEISVSSYLVKVELERQVRITGVLRTFSLPMYRIVFLALCYG